MQVAIPHSITYDFDASASVSEVTRALVAQEKLLRESLVVLTEMFPNLDIESVRVSVRNVSQESPLHQTLQAIIVGAYSPEIAEEMPDIINALTGYDVPDSFDGLISVLVLLLALYGVEWLFKRMRKAISPVLSRQRKRLTEQAAYRAGVTEASIERAVERALSKRERATSSAAIDLLRPGQRHGARSISSGDYAKLEREVLDEVPTEAEMAAIEPETKSADIDNIDVEFRRHDLDKPTGWAAVIDIVSKDRVALHLAPHINPASIFDQKSVKADVTVTYVSNITGEYKPSLYYIRQIREPF
ncbi:hypothetical protein [Ancylobacter sp. IITR112]|uniref:hypothetical protein n=1 Tax=Ancylobacter sp. IITR112 TaxID=3138073 RepID=UPI00352BC998